MSKLMRQIIPFIILGMVLIALAFVTVLFLYLLIFGAAVGLILFSISWIRQRFFSSKHLVKTEQKKKSGITIDHQD